ncbi:MAG TPA: hypothetical protein VGF45_17915, partial [Polyangia bacterium]
MSTRTRFWLCALVTLTASSCVDLARPNGLGRVSDRDAEIAVEAVGGNGMVPAGRPDGGTGIRDGAPPDQMASSGDLGRADGGNTATPTDVRPAGDLPLDVTPTQIDTAPSVDSQTIPTPDAGGGAPAKLVLGAACTSGSVCQSGNCVDGVCCDGGCSGLCVSCRLPGLVGQCRPMPSGADPDNECEETTVSSCGRDGVCDGAGACRLRAAGTVCGNVSCSGSTVSEAPQCNGSGQCVAGTSRSCAPYSCGAGACGSRCERSSDCASGNVCSGNMCLPSSSVLVVDDFGDASLLTTTMGGEVTWDNQNIAQVNGEARFSWNGVNVWQGFISAYRDDFCAYDLRPYRTLRFRMRSSSGAKAVRVFMAMSNGTCSADANPLLKTITVTPTMTVFDIDLSNL